MIDDLLELADHLAHKDTGRPKKVSLRRAVSSAYYALFHSLAKLCADELAGSNSSWLTYTPVYRHLDHRDARRVLQSASSFGPDVVFVARIFLTLQARRHEADYSPEPFAVSRAQTDALIAEAHVALSKLRSLDAPTRRKLAVHLIVKPRQN